MGGSIDFSKFTSAEDVLKLTVADILGPEMSKELTESFELMNKPLDALCKNCNNECYKDVYTHEGETICYKCAYASFKLSDEDIAAIERSFSDEV